MILTPKSKGKAMSFTTIEEIQSKEFKKKEKLTTIRLRRRKRFKKRIR